MTLLPAGAGVILQDPYQGLTKPRPYVSASRITAMKSSHSTLGVWTTPVRMTQTARKEKTTSVALLASAVSIYLVNVSNVVKDAVKVAKFK